MTNPSTVDAGAITQRPPSQEHIQDDRAQQLEQMCRQYLKHRSELEAVDRETDRLVSSLGKVTASVASFLGPLEMPVIVPVDGVNVVVNVAEGLLVPKQVTASLQVAATIEDLLGEGAT